MNEGKRIYVVVAKTVLHPILTIRHGVNVGKPSFGRGRETREIRQPLGRQAAQAVHAGRKLERARRVKQFDDITTIVLQARDTFELMHIQRLLEARFLRFVEYRDHNPAVYKTEDRVLTAIALFPVSVFQVVGILDYLPKWPE